MTVAAFEIEEIDLVEWVFRFAFALEDERRPVRRELAFTTTLAFKDKVARVGEKLRFGTDWLICGTERSCSQNGGGECPGNDLKSQLHGRMLDGGRHACNLAAVKIWRLLARFAVDQDGYRPVVHKRNLHVSTELAR